MPSGTAELDFGVFPGKVHATVVVAEASVGAGSRLEAYVEPATTADHSEDEHMLEKFRVFAREKNPGVGFTIHGVVEDGAEPLEVYKGASLGAQASGLLNPSQNQMPTRGGATRTVWGRWNVGWATT